MNEYPIYRPDGTLYAVYTDAGNNQIKVTFALNGQLPSSNNLNSYEEIIDKNSFRNNVYYLSANDFNIHTPSVDNYFDSEEFEPISSSSGKNTRLLKNVDGSLDALHAKNQAASSNPAFKELIDEGWEVAYDTTTGQPLYLYNSGNTDQYSSSNMEVVRIDPSDPNGYSYEIMNPTSFNELARSTNPSIDTGEIFSKANQGKYIPLETFYNTINPDGGPDAFLTFMEEAVDFDTDVDYIASVKAANPGAKSRREVEKEATTSTATDAMKSKDQDLNPSAPSNYTQAVDAAAERMKARDEAAIKGDQAASQSGASPNDVFAAKFSDATSETSSGANSDGFIAGDVKAANLPIAGINNALNEMETNYQNRLNRELEAEKANQERLAAQSAVKEEIGIKPLVDNTGKVQGFVQEFSDGTQTSFLTVNGESKEIPINSISELAIKLPDLHLVEPGTKKVIQSGDNVKTTLPKDYTLLSESPTTASNPQPDVTPVQEEIVPPAPSQTPQNGNPVPSTPTQTDTTNLSTTPLGETAQNGKIVDSNGNELGTMTYNMDTGEYVIQSKNPDGTTTKSRFKNIDQFVEQNPDVAIIGADNKPLKRGKNIIDSKPNNVTSLNTSSAISSSIEGTPTTVPTNPTNTTQNATIPSNTEGAAPASTSTNTNTSYVAPIETPSIEQEMLKIGKNSSVADKKKLQEYLKSKGLYNGKIDGIWGPKTEAGINATRKAYEESKAATAEQIPTKTEEEVKLEPTVQTSTTSDGTIIETKADGSQVATTTQGQQIVTIPETPVTTANNSQNATVTNNDQVSNNNTYVPIEEDPVKALQRIKSGNTSGFFRDKYGDLTKGTLSSTTSSLADQVQASNNQRTQGYSDAINQMMVDDVSRTPLQRNKRGTEEGMREAEIANMARMKVQNPSLDFGRYLASADEARMYERFTDEYYNQAKRDARKAARTERKNERQLDRLTRKQDKDFYRTEAINRRVNDALYDRRPDWMERAGYKLETLFGKYDGKNAPDDKNYPGVEQAKKEWEEELLRREALSAEKEQARDAKWDTINHRQSAERNRFSTNPGANYGTKAITEATPEYWKALAAGEEMYKQGDAQALKNAGSDEIVTIPETPSEVEIDANDIVEQLEEQQEAAAAEIKEVIDSQKEVEKKQSGGYTDPFRDFGRYGARTSEGQRLRLSRPGNEDYYGNRGTRFGLNSERLFGDVNLNWNPEAYYNMITGQYDPYLTGDLDGIIASELSSTGTSDPSQTSTTQAAGTTDPSATSYIPPTNGTTEISGTGGTRDNSIDPFSGQYRRRALNIYGNRMQHYGDLIPTLFNANKAVFDRPERQSAINNAHDFAYLQGVKNNMMTLNSNDNRGAMAGMHQYLNANARGAGSRLSNMQSAYSNYATQLDKDANNIQNQNVAQMNTYYDALKKTTDARRDESRRVDEANREHRATYEQYIIDSLKSGEKTLKNYGQMNNKEYEQYLGMSMMNAKNPNFKFKIDNATGRVYVDFAGGIDADKRHEVDPDKAKETTANIQERERLSRSTLGNLGSRYTSGRAAYYRNRGGLPESQLSIFGDVYEPHKANEDQIGKAINDQINYANELNKAAEEARKKQQTTSSNNKLGGYVKSYKKDGGTIGYILNNKNKNSIFNNNLNNNKRKYI